MSQFDFGNLSSPLHGADFIDNNLEPWRDALHTLHSGIERPTYAVPGLMWLDISESPWVLKVFQGSEDIVVGFFDSGAGTFTPAGAAVAVTASDQQPGNLNQKITVSTAFTKTVSNPGANEALNIAANFANQATVEAGTNDTQPVHSLGVLQSIQANALGGSKYATTQITFAITDTYQNTSGHAEVFSIAYTSTATGSTRLQASPDNLTWVDVGVVGTSFTVTDYLLPAGWYIKLLRQTQVSIVATYITRRV